MKVKASNLLRVAFIIALFQGLITTYVGFRQCVYLCDLLLGFTCMFLLKSKKKSIPSVIKWPILCFSVIVFGGILFNMAFDIQTIWGLRNVFRFFVFLLLILKYMNESDVDFCVEIYEIVFWFHIVLVCFQYFVGGYHRDYLGGIWGVSQGCNGGLMLYYIGIVVISIYRYNQKQVGFVSLLTSSLAMCITAAWAELKFFYIVLIILWLTYIIFSKCQLRTVGVILALIICIPVASIALGNAFAEHSDFFNITYLINRVIGSTNYASSYDIGRSAVFTKIPELMDAWLGYDSTNLVGIGIGQADYSTAFNFLNSDFYMAYEATHYTWLLTAFLLVETGYLGLFTYVSIFVTLLIYSVYQYRIKNNNVFLYEILLCIACLMIIFYNASLRTNYAYIIFFLLAVPFINQNRELFKEKKSRFKNKLRYKNK